MLNKQDVRHLLIAESWPEGYEDAELYAKANDILWENEKYKGEHSYQKHIRDEGNKRNEEGKIKFLQGVLYLFDLDPETALYILKETRSKYNTKEQVQKALNNRIFDIRVEKIQAEGKEQESKEISFASICIPIERHLKITLDRDVTVEKYWGWVDELKKETA
jgi:hypothetical protein